jgi:hypothetical protein
MPPPQPLPAPPQQIPERLLQPGEELASFEQIRDAMLRGSIRIDPLWRVMINSHGANFGINVLAYLYALRV